MAKVLHTCTECVPIDASIIDTYVALVETNRRASTAEDEREVAEAGRVSAEDERTRVFAEDHGTAADDHTLAVADHGAAQDDHTAAVEDHRVAVLDHEAAVEDHAASSAATTRADSAAAAAEHMVDIHQGPPGGDGVGITNVEQTVISVANGGINTVRLTLSNGNYYDIHIKNGNASNGLFSTLTALNTACPNPSVGDYAYVGAGFPAEIYVCNTDGVWSDSGEEYEGDSIDLTEYVRRADVYGELMSARAKNALMAVFQKVAFAVQDVSAEIAELNSALFNLDELVGIEAEYTQGSTVIWSDGASSLDDLLPGLVVNAVYGDGTRVAISYGYTLSGTLTVGTSTITVEYQDFTDTFDVVVTLYGSKMSYVLNDGVAIAHAFSAVDSTYFRIGASSTTRKHFFLSYGLHKMKNTSGTETRYYPLPIPKTARSMTVTITQSTMKIGGYFLAWNSNTNEYVYSEISTQSFTAAGFTKTLEQDGTEQLYYVPGIAPASGNIPSGQPTAITIEFSNE